MNFIRNSEGKAKIILVLVSLVILIGGEIFVYVILSRSQKVDTSNWKTYRSEELEFEVKYPQEWAITTKEEALNIEKETERIFSVSSGALHFDIFVRSNNKKNMRLLRGLLETPIRNVVAINDSLYSIQEHLNISGFSAVIYYADRHATGLFRDGLIPPPVMGEAVLKKGETIFHYRLVVEQEALLEKNKDIFKNILSTFRFTK